MLSPHKINFKLTLDVTSSLDVTLLDHDLLTRILQNSISNWVKLQAVDLNLSDEITINFYSKRTDI